MSLTFQKYVSGFQILSSMLQRGLLTRDLEVRVSEGVPDAEGEGLLLADELEPVVAPGLPEVAVHGVGHVLLRDRPHAPHVHVDEHRRRLALCP